MTLSEYGAILRAEREKQGIALEDVANKLKMSMRILRALEEGDYENLPHLAYVKGFLRSYGTFLGIGMEELQEMQRALALDEQWAESIPRIETASSQRLAAILPPLILLLLLAGIVGGAGYLLWQRGIVPQAIDWVMEKTKSMTHKNEGDSKKVSEAKEAVVPTVRSDIRETLEERPSVPTPVPPMNALPSQLQVPSLPASESANKLQQVTLVATEACWINSNADKSESKQFSLRKGDTFTVTFQNQLELKLGNAGGVHFRYNGKEIPPAGKVGQVKTIVFPSLEIQ